jgi:hypothetical protein
VLSNADAAFGPPAEADQSDVPVMFVSVNITADAVRNNVLVSSLGRNSITFVGRDEAMSQAFAQGAAGAAVAFSEKLLGDEQPVAQQLEQVRAQGAPEPALPPQVAEGASGVIAVEAPPEQVAAFLNDLANDRENVTAVAVLAESSGAEAGQPENAIAAAATYNRNADKAMEQVTGNWRFEPSGEAGEPVRLERLWHAPAAGAARAGAGSAPGNGAIGRSTEQRLADESEAAPERVAAGGADARSGDADGYSGGFGGGLGARGEGRGGVSSPPPEQAPKKDAALVEEKTPLAAEEPGALVQNADLYSDTARGGTGTVAADREGAPPDPGADALSGVPGLAQSDPSANPADPAVAGKAWIVSPLQVRKVATADDSQAAAQHYYDFGLQAAQSAPSGSTLAPAPGASPGSADLQFRADPPSNEIEDLRLQNTGSDLKDVSRADAPTEFAVTEDRPNAERPAPLEPAAEPSLGSRSRNVTLDEPAAPQQQTAQREEEAQLAKGLAPARPRKPVRVVLFFNVLPAEQQPAGASGPPAALQSPSDAAD